MKNHLVTAGVLASSLMFANSAAAVEWTIGVGVGIVPDYQGSDDYQAAPLWNLKASKLYHDDTYIQILATKLNSNLLAHDNFRLGISGQYVLERDDVDNNAVDHLPDTDDGIMLGIMGGYDFDLSNGGVFGLELDVRYDVGGDIGGLYTGRLKYMKPFGSSWVFTAGLESTYATDDYMDELFGVSGAGAASSGLSIYNPDAGFKDVGIGASLTYMISQRWSVTGSANYAHMIGDADDSSPVTDQGSESQFLGGLMVSLHF
jgi:outer membrane protein